jgi:hypothetical protein
MSTFLTQGVKTTSSSRPGSASAKPESNSQFNSQLQYAPFVKPTDKVKKDAAELSFADFQPKRFALNYDPPMIGNPSSSFTRVLVLEYLVPSTGKLYHHKMKLRQLKGDSDTDEMLEYLQKRHSLYFTTQKVTDKQITDLINRLKFKLKQSEFTKAKTQAPEKLKDQTTKVLNDNSSNLKP